MQKEHLASIRLQNGDAVDFYRDHDKGGICISDKDSSVALPGATGEQAIELFSIMEAMGGTVELPEETEEV